MKTFKSFKEHINETVDVSIGEIVNKIVEDCGPFLEQIDGNMEKYPLFRGGDSTEIFRRKSIPRGREPKDIPPRISEIIDDWFEEEFDVRFRSEAIFGTGDKELAVNFGNPFLVFPIGDFQFAWSRQVRDIFYFLKITAKIANGASKEQIESELKDANFRTNNLKDAIKSRVEIMIHGDEYYIVSADFAEQMDLPRELKDAWEFHK